VGAALLIFFLVRIAPGDVAQHILGDSQYETEEYEQLRSDLGLDRPQVVQLGSWFGNVATGDFGRSLWTNRPVSSMIWQRIPVTLELSLLSIFVAMGLGIPLGAISAVCRGKFGDYLSRLIVLAGLSLPSFWLGALFILLTSRLLGWAPPLTYVPITDDPYANLQQFLPAATVIGLHISAIIARMTRSSLLEVLGTDYIRTATAKGLAYHVVVARHALRNALIPIVTVSGVLLGYLLGGSAIAEIIFNLPGLGRLLVDAVSVRDYPVIQAVTLLGVSSVLIVTLLVDLSYALIDPRVQLGGSR
jgi:peptide/nickel transport system permease protein